MRWAKKKSAVKVAPPKQTKSASFLGNPDQCINEEAKPEDAIPHNGVSYADIKKKHLANGTLFEDPDFLAVEESLFTSRKLPFKPVWKRPKDIVANPSLYVGGASRFDIAQGVLGDCWLLAAVAALCQYDGLFKQVVPPDQSFEEDYCGVFRFRFWQYGRWEEVVVDDRLPTHKNKLMFLHSAEKNEFWSALLEKAYAKLCGTYEALKGGQTSEAMEDFTGGVTETFDMKKDRDGFFKLLEKAVDRQSLMCCSIESKEVEAKCANGLIKGHAYTITGVNRAVLKGTNTEVQLLRVRNPWGNEREWNGAWSDGSDEWNNVTDEEKKEIGLSYDDDGEFWMCFDDFASNFTKVEICMLSPDSAGDLTKKRWEMNIYQSTWQNYVSAGGCRNFPNTFGMNPQFTVKCEDPDDDEDVDNCTIIIGLIQKGRRKKKALGGAGNLTIGFVVYQLGDDADDYRENGRLTKEFFLTHKSFARSANFLNSREITGRFSFPPAKYVIVPSSYKANEEGDFVLRIFSEKAHSSEYNDTTTEIDLNEPTYTAQDDENLDVKLKPFFEKIAGDDEEIDAFELQKVFASVFKDEMNGKTFSLEACRSMLSMVDNGSRNGKLDYLEFRELWRTVLEWKNAFNEYDKDNSDDMSASEIRDALNKLGMKLSTPALSSIALRYANKNGNVSMDDFVQICCRIVSSYGSYTAMAGKQFSLDQFIMSSVYI